MCMGKKWDEIRIDNLEVYAHHGVFPEEKEKGQPFFVNMVLYTDTRKAGQRDDLTLSTHYGEVCHLVTEGMQQHICDLIETVAENLAAEVLGCFPLVRALDVEIRKPQAPIGLPFESVSVKIHRGWHRVYVALGSNMGDRKKYLQMGVDAMEARQDIRLEKVSSWRQTAPYGGVEQADFLNGVMEIRTLLTPRELLEYLRREQMPVGVASSTRLEAVTQELKQAGLYEYFHTVVGGDQLKRSKPEPDIYLMACEKMTVVPERTYAIEDSHNGIRAAYRAGMRPVMVPDMLPATEEMRGMSVIVLEDLLEVKKWFEGIDK